MLWEWCFLGVENGYLGHFFHLQEMGNGKWEMGRALNIDRSAKILRKKKKKRYDVRIGADDTKSAFLEPHTAMLRWTWVKPVEKWPNRKSSYVLQLVFLFKNFDCNDVSLGSVVVCDCCIDPPSSNREWVNFFGHKCELFCLFSLLFQVSSPPISNAILE